MNHTASHVLTSVARVICGITPAGRDLFAGLGEEDAKRLHDAVIPILLDAWNMREVDTTVAVRLVETLRSKAIAASKERSTVREREGSLPMDWPGRQVPARGVGPFAWIGRHQGDRDGSRHSRGDARGALEQQMGVRQHGGGHERARSG